MKEWFDGQMKTNWLFRWEVFLAGGWTIVCTVIGLFFALAFLAGGRIELAMLIALLAAINAFAVLVISFVVTVLGYFLHKLD